MSCSYPLSLFLSSNPFSRRWLFLSACETLWLRKSGKHFSQRWIGIPKNPNESEIRFKYLVTFFTAQKPNPYPNSHKMELLLYDMKWGHPPLCNHVDARFPLTTIFDVMNEWGGVGCVGVGGASWSPAHILAKGGVCLLPHPTTTDGKFEADSHGKTSAIVY